MKTNWLMMILLVATLGLSGCGIFGGTTDIAKFAEEETVSWFGEAALLPPAKAEQMLYEEFVTSTVDWLPGDEAKAAMARDAINQQFEYMKAKLDINGSLPYYTYRSGFEFIQFNYKMLEEVLDRRVAQGAISEAAEIIYEFVRRDVNTKLQIQRQRISQAEDSINSKTSEAQIENMRRFYATLKPLVDLAL